MAVDFRKSLRRQKFSLEWNICSERLPDEIEGDFIITVRIRNRGRQWEYHTDVGSFHMEQPGRGYIEDRWGTFTDWDEGQDEIEVYAWAELPKPFKEGENKDKHGHWINIGHKRGPFVHPDSVFYKCSLCGYEAYWIPSPICPECWADMTEPYKEDKDDAAGSESRT